MTPAHLLASIESGGFEALEWADETAWVMEWFRDLGTRVAHAKTTATLPALLEAGPARMLNFVAGLDAGVLSVHRGAFTRR